MPISENITKLKNKLSPEAKHIDVGEYVGGAKKEQLSDTI